MALRQTSNDKRQKIKLLPSVFICQYTRVKIFVSAVNSILCIFVSGIYLRIIRGNLFRLPSAVKVMLKLSMIVLGCEDNFIIDIRNKRFPVSFAVTRIHLVSWQLEPENVYDIRFQTISCCRVFIE